MSKALSEFKLGSLDIKVAGDDRSASIIWRGVSDERDPGPTLRKYFATLLPQLKGKQVRVDFRPIEYMNSASVGAMITFVKDLNTAGISATLVYRVENTAQRVNFQCMKNLAMTMSGIEVTS
jgi:hypothetical protein